MLLNINEYSDNLVDNPINYISVSDSDKGKISYLNLDRIKSVSKDGGDLWKDSRYHAKPGSFVNKLFKGISQREVEIFSSLFRSESNKPKFELKVLVGEEIRTAYNYKSHSSDYGTLGASCMKHDSCYDYLNIYAKNKDVISMLAMYDEHKRIMGRAILWQEGSNKIMDRIYSVNDEILHLPFKKWATENGFLYKTKQNYFDTLNFENMKTDKKELKLSFNIDMLDDNSFPYMDTFKFADTKKGIIYNYKPDGTESDISANIKIFCSTDGSTYDGNFMSFDDIDRVYRNTGDMVLLDYCDKRTTHSNTTWSNLNDKYILKSHSIYNEELDDYIFTEEMDKHNDKRPLK